MPRTHKTRRRPARAVATALLLLLAAGSFDAASMPTGVREGYLKSAIGKDSAGAVSVAAGQFRSVAANLLWLKVVDHYHHQHMADGGDWSKKREPPADPQDDHRAGPAFRRSPTPSWAARSCARTGHVREGEEVLKRGIAQNPKEYELYRQMALLITLDDRRPADALPYAQKGLETAPDDFSRNIMKKLCKTLEGRIADARQARA